MRKHTGMKPQDIVILLKIISMDSPSWLSIDLSKSLQISASEVSESLNRNRLSGLLGFSTKQVSRGALLEFILHGIKYVFPVQPGAIVWGTPTAHSALPLAKKIVSNEKYVWPDPEGDVRGQAIEPLYPSVPKAVKHDPKLHELLALVDAIRVGRSREVKLAEEALRKQISPHGK